MSRVPFSQVLKNAGTDIRREYDRLYSLFFLKKIPYYARKSLTLKNLCASSFLKLPFHGTCISLDDFDDFYKYHFKEDPKDFTLDYLVSFCEYSYNLVYHSGRCNSGMLTTALSQEILFFLRQIKMVIGTIGYMANTQNDLTDFVPKDQAAISVAEIVEPELSYKVIEYNHHSMKGDLERKRATLLALADKLEPLRKKLGQINDSLKSDLFFLLNNLNVRHNNTEPGGGKYIPFVAGMENEEIEHWYDELYQMCLLAFLELDHLDRKNSIEQLKKDIQNRT